MQSRYLPFPMYAKGGRKPSIPDDVVVAIRTAWMNDLKPNGGRLIDLHELFPQYHPDTLRVVARGKCYKNVGGPVDPTVYCKPKKTKRTYAGPYRRPRVIEYVQHLIEQNRRAEHPLSKSLLTDHIEEAVAKKYHVKAGERITRRRIRDIIEGRYTYKPHTTARDRSGQDRLEALRRTAVARAGVAEV